MFNITGTEIAYLYICKRKLWLSRHGLRPENEHVNVQIGRFIQETTFPRHEKEIKLGDIGVVDWAEFKDGRIHETKKGRSPMAADIAQTRYYLWWLRNNGINVDTCIIHYPKLRKTRELVWEESFIERVKEDLCKAREIVSAPVPPEYSELKWCKSCAYFDFCTA